MRSATPQARLAALHALVSPLQLPAAVVDLEAFDANLAWIRGALLGKTLRIATKSIRHLGLLQRIATQLGTIPRLMSYSIAEAEFLAAAGFKDILLAYPLATVAEAERAARLNTHSDCVVSCVVDCEAHVALLEAGAKSLSTNIPVTLDVDASMRWLNDNVHVGVRRSPLHAPQDILQLADFIATNSGVRLDGLMMYEAQIAGLTDANPFTRAANSAKRIIKRAAKTQVRERRGEIVHALAKRGHALRFVNGGGSGSVEFTVADESVTEIAIGSAFLAGHLFDYYETSPYQAALFFALRVTRAPAPNVVTCHQGGYVASGEPGWDRLPVPVYPLGLSYLSLEGAGEVQTPFRTRTPMRVGDAVLLRPAKSGEFAEYFDDYALVQSGTVIETAPTYRGQGKQF